MNKDGNYRLNVSFDGLVTDFGWVSLNKKRETICGDYFDIMENDSDHVLVLSDGLGSGVKANILSTLTARMLSHMIIKKLPIYDAVAAVADTLPVCSVRHLAYSTFTVLDIRGRQALLYQFDNPDAILIRNGKVTAYPFSTFTLKEKVIHESTFDLREDDMLILMSDGVTNAGMGKTTDGGWGRNEVLRFCQKKYRPGMSAQEMAVAIAYAGLALNLEETDDDPDGSGLTLLQEADGQPDDWSAPYHRGRHSLYGQFLEKGREACDLWRHHRKNRSAISSAASDHHRWIRRGRCAFPDASARRRSGNRRVTDFGATVGILRRFPGGSSELP